MFENVVDTQQPKNLTPEVIGGQNAGRTFTQDEVNRIVSDRLAREREKLTRQPQQPQEDEREKALKAREARLDCRDYLDSKKYPAELLDMLDCSDAEKFKATVDKLVQSFPALLPIKAQPTAVKRPQFGESAHGTMPRGELAIANAFKPPKI